MMVAEETASDDMSIEDEDPSEINRQFSMLADSEESVESDEEFYFVDDKTPKKKPLASSGVKRDSSRLKVTVKGPQLITGDSEGKELSSSADVDVFNITKVDDFANMMETFEGFTPDGKQKNEMEKSVRSFKNQLFVATNGDPRQKEDSRLGLQGKHGTKTPGSNTPSGIGKTEEDGCDEKDNSPDKSIDFSASELSSEKVQHSHLAKVPASCENSETTNHTATRVSSVVSEKKNGIEKLQVTGKQHVDEKVLHEENKDPSRVDHVSEDMSLTVQIPKQVERKHSSKSEAEKPNTSGRNSPQQINTNSESEQQPTSTDDLNSSQEIQNSSFSSKSSEKSQGTYITVLPGSLEKSAGDDAKNSTDVEKEELGTETDSLLSKTGKSRGRCLSYVVVSSGEGHVDLRLKVKSKQDLKKDGQSMFLIWRVNSKL